MNETHFMTTFHYGLPASFEYDPPRRPYRPERQPRVRRAVVRRSWWRRSVTAAPAGC